MTGVQTCALPISEQENCCLGAGFRKHYPRCCVAADTGVLQIIEICAGAVAVGPRDAADSAGPGGQQPAEHDACADAPDRFLAGSATGRESPPMKMCPCPGRPS